MLKSNLKKLISFVSAAAMFVSLSAPAVFADEIDNADDTVNLLASGEVLMSDNFDNLDAGALIQYEYIPTATATPTPQPDQTAAPTATPKPTQGPYTDLETVDLYVGGGSTNNNENTGIFIENGAGVDGSKALALVSDRKANASFGPRMSFKLPAMDDKYVITFKAYPTSKQDLYLNDSVESNTAAKAMGLNKDEWNDVEIFVSRSGKEVGRLINVNGVTNTDLSGTTGEAPVVWGVQSNNAGTLYIDNIEIKVSTSLPTPIPTASPEPVRQLGIGDGNDFEEYSSGMQVITMTSSAQDPADDIAGFLVHIGSRNGGSSNTNCTIGDGKEGNGLVIANGQFYSSNRGARAQLITPKVESDVNYKVSFDVKKTDAENDLYFASSTSSNDGTPAGLAADVWSKAEIYMAGGQQIIFIDGRFIKASATTELPVLWGADKNYVGNIIIDNYMIEAADSESVLNAIAASLSITNEERTVYLGNDGVYNFISGFKVSDVIIGRSVSWQAFELSEDDWIATSDIKITGTNLTLNGVSDDKDYKLVATVSDGELTSKKEFMIKYIKTEDVVQTVIDNLDLPTTNIRFENNEYSITGNFSVPLNEWVTNIEWTVTDPSSIQIDKDGDAKVFPKNTEPMEMTATVSYNGQSMTKTFPVSLLKYHRDCLHKVEDELVKTVLYPKGNDGEALTSVTLSPDAATVLSYDVNFKTISADEAALEISWKSSDTDVLTNEGVISVVDKNAHPVTLTKTVTYTLGGSHIASASKDYNINVQFNPDTMQAGIDEIVKNYAASKNADEKSAQYQDAYNKAMEVLSDRYKTRGDAVYTANFDEIPASVDDDFTLPTTGYFGSKITWGSSSTSIKINGENAKVTQPSKDTNVQLKATFTSGASTNANAYTATVEVEGTGKSSSGSGGSGGGGSSYRGSLGTSSYTNPVTNPVFGLEPTATATPAPVANGFTDLGSVTWAAEAINALADKGVVSGRDAVTFAPNDDITRAEFAKIVVGAFNIELGATADLSDIDSSAWYAPYVGACYDAGIITGYDDGEFKPNNRVTRQEMAVMVLRAAQYKNVTIETPNEKVDFTDADKIASYAAEAIETLQKAGIINGVEDGKFAPEDTATRAQAAKILYTFCK